MGFTHLHLHTEYSLLDGATKVKELFPRIKEMGMDAVAITEHGNMGAVIKKYNLAKDAGVKLIFGAEPYICENHLDKTSKGKNFHLILLAKDLEGYQNLVKLISIANNEGFYYRSRIDKNLLRKYSKGLICMSACIGNDIAQAVIAGNETEARRIIEEYLDIFGKEDFYLEVQNHGIPEEEKVGDFYRRVALDYDLKIVATTDAHFLKADDAHAHEVMLAIQTNGDMGDPNRFKFDGSGYHVMSEEEVRRLFPNNPEYVDTSVEIANRCNVELDMGEPIFPDFGTPKGMSHKDYLYELCKEGLDERYKGKDSYNDAIERMKFELGVISKMGFDTYFLIVWDFMREAKRLNVERAVRGSGAGSIVAYSLGISQLDPLALDLLFERFLNPDRISLPDLDIDFGDKEAILDYVRTKYGEEKVAMIGTFGTMSAKAVLKDVMRVFKVPFDEANAITKLVNEKTIEKSLNAKNDAGKLTPEAEELQDFAEKHKNIFDVANRLEGCVRHKGVHACGVVWGKKGISEYIPTYGKKGDVITQIEGGDVEAYGLVKFDFLGVETLNTIRNVLDKIGKDGDWLEKIPLDDDVVYEMYRKGETNGVFQVESEGMKKTLKSVQPTCFDDIIGIVALYRPGPMQYLEVYGNRKHGKEVATYPHEKVEKILAPTYGIMVYQEQVMLLARALANFTRGDSDVLRKAIGKKKIDLMNKMEVQFKEGCVEFSGMDPVKVDKLWDDIVKFAEYSFNKSHAAAYALISYRTAYLKKYYPVEFYAATISSAVGNPEKLAFYLDAARSEGIKILHPDVNTSQESFDVVELEGESIIRVGLSGIKNVGGEAVRSILAARPFEEYQDFINKVDLSKVNKRVCQSLISVGCFDELGINRASLLDVYADVQKTDLKETQMTLFGGGVAYQIDYPDLPPMSLTERLKAEEELLGVCVSGHVMDAFKESKMDFTPINSLANDMDADVFGIVKRYTQIVTKNGADMAFMDICDKTGACKVTVFPRDYEECLAGQAIKEGDGVRLGGRFVGNEEFGDAFIAKTVDVCQPVE